jgi:hypothetical protein
MNMHLAQDRDIAAAGRHLPSLMGAAVMRVDGPLECVSKKVRHLFDWWYRAADGLPPPDWKLFDVVEHKAVVANLYLIKRMAPRQWVFTLKGEGVHEIFPRNKATGPVGELHDPATTLALTDYYETIAATGCCHLVRGMIVNARKDHVDIESIDCPFIDSRSGRIVILGAIERIAIRHPLPE